MDINNLYFSLLFSIIGIGFYSYGKKNNRHFMLPGLAMMLYPYFVNSLMWMVIIGGVLFALPFLLMYFVGE